VGRGPSGQDIAADIVPHARCVYHSSREPRFKGTGGIVKPDILRIDVNTVMFLDTSTCQPDSIVLCNNLFLFPVSGYLRVGHQYPPLFWV